MNNIALYLNEKQYIFLEKMGFDRRIINILISKYDKDKFDSFSKKINEIIIMEEDIRKLLK
jgi:hypothetical protein